VPERRGRSGKRGRLELPDGTRIGLRSLGADDRELLLDMFDRLGEESRYRRFLTPKKRLTDRELAALSAVDHHDHEALVALAADGRETGVGVARYVRSAADPAVAEVAVAVTDDWQRRGVGGAVLEHLAARAREEGVRRFSALVLAENRAVRDLFERVGDVTLTPVGDGQVELEIELPDRRGAGSGLARALRAAARREIAVAGGLLHRGPEALRARLPALSAAPEPRRAGPIRTVLAAFDGSDQADAAVRGAAELARGLDARLLLVRAYGPPGQAPGEGLRGAARRAPSPDAPAAEEPDPELWALAEELRGDGLAVSMQLRGGEAAGAIIDSAEERGADLIVLGDRGMTGISRFLLGSVANRVSHNAPCSVLIVRSPSS
jgi:nucleotide-binding universal stress UspA family protein/GNAT superfamily N-acetyltransferase